MNKIPRKKFNAIFFILASFSFCHAENFLDGVHFEISPYYTFHWGVQDEFVYESLDGAEYKISELNWDQKPQNIFGAELKSGWKDFYFGGRAEFSLAQNCGIVKDYDWLNRELLIKGKTFPLEYLDLNTHYSESPLELIKDYKLSFFTEYKFNLPKNFTLGPKALYEYHYNFFKANGGFKQYATAHNGNSSIPDYYDKSYTAAEKKSLGDVEVLGLERETYTIYFGLNLSFKPIENFVLSTDLYSSIYSKINSLDYHYQRSLNFLDLMDGWFKEFKGNFCAEYYFTKHHSIYLNFSGLCTIIYKGISYNRSINSDADWTRGGNSGASFKNMELTLGYRFTLK